MQYKYKYVFRPRHSDFDDYGIAHHSRFFCWFEEARYEAFEAFGEKAKILFEKYKFPLSFLNCKFSRSVDTFDKLAVIVSIDLPLECPVLAINYRLTDLSGKKLYARGITKHAFVDRDLKILNKIPTEFEDIIKIFMENNRYDEKSISELSEYSTSV